MPVPLSYPGVYVEELASGTRTIVGVSTSVTAFVGRAPRGPVGEPVTVNSFGEYARVFGGHWKESSLASAVNAYFLNGGSTAVIVRLYAPLGSDDDGVAVPATGPLSLVAASQGGWASSLRVTVDTNVSGEAATGLGVTEHDLFNLTISDGSDDGAEEHRNLTIVDSARRVDLVLARESDLVRWKGSLAAKDDRDAAAKKLADARTALTTTTTALTTARAEESAAQAALDAEKAKPTPDAGEVTRLESELATKVAAREKAKTEFETAYKALVPADDATGGSDGRELATTHYLPDGGEVAKTGLWALERTDLFNLLVLPAPQDKDLPAGVVDAAIAYCRRRRAFLLLDPPVDWADEKSAREGKAGLSRPVDDHAAIYFPRLLVRDPLSDNRPVPTGPAAAVAGVFARTDATRGVWKAPAGLDATLAGTAGLAVGLTDDENGRLNKIGVNCLRVKPAVGSVVWGARTLAGDDRVPSDWSYVPVRRLALYIEESLFRGTQWVVFEPNDEPLWAQIRLGIGTFMHDLFRQGAFQGTTPNEAYQVKVDKETTTQSDINRGVVNIIVGFAPLKPAEFVRLRIRQLAGQLEV